MLKKLITTGLVLLSVSAPTYSQELPLEDYLRSFLSPNKNYVTFMDRPVTLAERRKIYIGCSTFLQRYVQNPYYEDYMKSCLADNTDTYPQWTATCPNRAGCPFTKGY